MGRGDLTETRWRRLEPALQVQTPRIGRPNRNHRELINAILWVVRTGVRCRGLADRYGPRATVVSRFYRWREQGVWPRLLEGLQQDADITGELGRGIHYVDGTIVRAINLPLAVKMGRRPSSGPLPGRLWNEGPSTSKGTGKPVNFVLSPGQRHEARVSNRGRS